MVTLHLEPELEQALHALAETTGRSPSSLVGEALVRYLEDRVDYAAAIASIKAEEATGEPSLTDAEMREALGL